jgi:inosose dehydratase
MPYQARRREFLLQIAAAGAVIAAPSFLCGKLSSGEPLYPPMDLSYFDTPISPAPSEIHIGYAAITWGGQDRQAIDDIAALGFTGIQLRANAVKEFSSPAELRELLEKRQLRMVALSSGNLRIDPSLEAEEIARHTANARFVHDVGGLYLQVIDERPKGRPITAEDYSRLGRLLTKLGKRTADLGVSLGYHNHMGTLGETPDAVDQILHASDPRYVKLELDIAHYLQGGGNPAQAIETYAERLLFLHLKDVETTRTAANANPSYRFVELGRGRMDLPAVFDALRKINFRGWAIVELDSVPGAIRTPKDSAAISKEYLEKRLGVAI